MPKTKFMWHFTALLGFPLLFKMSSSCPVRSDFEQLKQMRISACCFLVIFNSCVCMCACAHMYISESVWRSQRFVSGVFLYYSPSYFLRQGLFTEPGTHWFSWNDWPKSSGDSLVPSAGIPDSSCCAWLYVGARNPDLYGKHFTHWVISLAPVFYISKLSHIWSSEKN